MTEKLGVMSLRQLKAMVTIAALISAMAACDEPDVDSLNKRMRELPLEQRYTLYLDSYSKTRPRRVELANELVILGDPAWRYIIRKASADASEANLRAASDALTLFNRTCSSEEYNGLIAAARRVMPTKAEFRSAVGQLRIACGKVTGRTLATYQADLDATCNLIGC
jgi:hypothetical protein